MRAILTEDEEAWAAYDAQVEEERLVTMQEYADLKAFLIQNCQRFGGFLTTYVLLTVSLEAALCTLTGATASFFYLKWIIHDVDSITGEDDVPMRDVDKIQALVPRRLSRILLGLRLSVQPRLVIPIALGASIGAFNQFSGDHLTLTEEGALILGFFSYKAALFSKVWDDLRPKFVAENIGRRGKPKYREIDDDWDMYGRKKIQSRGVIEADRILREEAARKAKR